MNKVTKLMNKLISRKGSGIRIAISYNFMFFKIVAHYVAFKETEKYVPILIQILTDGKLG